MKYSFYFSCLFFSILFSNAGHGMSLEACGVAVAKKKPSKVHQVEETLNFQDLFDHVDEDALHFSGGLNQCIAKKFLARKKSGWLQGQDWPLQSITREDYFNAANTLFVNYQHQDPEGKWPSYAVVTTQILEDQDYKEITSALGISEEKIRGYITNPKPSMDGSYQDMPFDKACFRAYLGAVTPCRLLCDWQDNATMLTVDFAASPGAKKSAFITSKTVKAVKEGINATLSSLQGRGQVEMLVVKNVPCHGPLQHAAFEGLRNAFPCVTSLVLDGNSVNEQWVSSPLLTDSMVHTQALGGASNTDDTPLTELSLANTLGRQHKQHILRNILSSCTHLVVLNLSSNQLGDLNIQGWCANSVLSSLESLDLSHNRLEWAEGYELFFTFLGHLQALNLSHNKIQDAEGTALARQLQNSKVSFISVDRNPMSEETRQGIIGERRPFHEYGSKEESEVASPKSPTSPLQKVAGVVKGVFGVK